MSRNKSESAIKYYSTHGAPQEEVDDSEGAQTEPVVMPKTPDLGGYASDVCLVGKRSSFSKYTQSALMHNP